MLFQNLSISADFVESRLVFKNGTTEMKATLVESTTLKEASAVVLVLHAPGKDASQLSHVWPTILKKKMRVIAPDLLGHGNSISEVLNWSMAEDEKTKENLFIQSMVILKGINSQLTQYNRTKSKAFTGNVVILAMAESCVIGAKLATTNESLRKLICIEPVLKEDSSSVMGFNFFGDLFDLGGSNMVMFFGWDKDKKIGADGKTFGSAKELLKEKSEILNVNLYSKSSYEGEVIDLLTTEKLEKGKYFSSTTTQESLLKALSLSHQ